MQDQHTHIHIEPPPVLVYAAVAALVLLALFLFAEFVNAAESFGYPSNPIQNTITVTGTGTATSSPDIATISFTVMQNASTVSAAQSAATTQSNSVIAALKALGIADADITTSSYSINPQYAPVRAQPVNEPIIPGGTSNTISGYQVSESVDVKVRDTSKASAVLQKLGDLGVQNVYGPNFAQADDTATKDAARAAAIKDAQKNAQTLAAQLGVHLGKITSFSENNGGVVYPVAYGAKSMATADSAAPELPTGTDSTTDTVSITYAIR